jgi:hypothetical protein
MAVTEVTYYSCSVIGKTVREPKETYAFQTLTHDRIVTLPVAEFCARGLCGKEIKTAFIAT